MSCLALAFLLAVQTAPAPQVPVAPSPELLQVRARLELDPGDPTALEDYSRLLGKQGDADGQLAYLITALDAFEKTEFDDPKLREQTLKRLSDALTALDKEIAALKEARDAYVKDLAWAMQLYAGNQKKPSNALEVAARILRYRPNHPLARAAVDEMLKKGDARLKGEATRLLSLGDLSRPRSFLAKWATEHRDWKKAGKIDTDGYSVRCNVGYDVLSYTARGLDQISTFYSSFYGSTRKNQIGKTDVALCHTRAEWAAEAKQPEVTDSPGVMAFINSHFDQVDEKDRRNAKLRFNIFAFDPRDVGLPLESLWPILWHEASHQYMQLAVGAHLVPLWLNEGMASYFEGARVSPSGEVALGLPAAERLRDLNDILSADSNPLEPTIAGEGSLTGQQYAIAWGIVYYLRHLERPSGEPMPPALLTKALAIAGSKDIGGMALFEEAVLKPMKLDLPAFQSEWASAMQTLHEIEAEPAECAAQHLERAEKALAAQHFDEALEFAHAALLRTPESPAPLLLSARTQRARSQAAKDKDLDLKDQALLWARRAHHAALVAGDAASEAKAAELAKAVDPGGFQKIADGERAYRKNLERLIGRRIEQGKPRSALAIAGRYLDDVLGDHRQDTLAADLRTKGTLRLERVVRVFDGQSLIGLSASEQRFQVEKGELVGHAERLDAEGQPQYPRAPLFVEAPLAPLFRFEGEVQLADADTQLALTFSQPGQPGARGFTFRPNLGPGDKKTGWRLPPFDSLLHGHQAALREAFLPELQAHDFKIEDASALPGTITAGRWIPFALVREQPGTLKLILDGEEEASCSVDPGMEGARVGLTVWGGVAHLRGLKAVEFDRL